MENGGGELSIFSLSRKTVSIMHDQKKGNLRLGKIPPLPLHPPFTDFAFKNEIKKAKLQLKM